MHDAPLTPPPTASARDRLLRYPIVRMLLALLWIASTFAIVATPFNLYVSDKLARKAGALLLCVVILGCY